MPRESPHLERINLNSPGKRFAIKAYFFMVNNMVFVVVSLNSEPLSLCVTAEIYL